MVLAYNNFSSLSHGFCQGTQISKRSGREWANQKPLTIFPENEYNFLVVVAVKREQRRRQGIFLNDRLSWATPRTKGNHQTLSN